MRLLVIHPQMDLTEVRDTLNKIPGIVRSERLMTAGADRYTPKGEKLEGTYRDSRWGMDLFSNWQKSEDITLGDALSNVTERLNPHKEYFKELVEKGCSLDIIIDWGIQNEEMVDASFTSDVLRKFSELSISLSFDMYLGLGRKAPQI